MSQSNIINPLIDKLADELSQKVYSKGLLEHEPKDQKPLLIAALISNVNQDNFDESLKIFSDNMFNEVNIPNKINQFCAFAVYNSLVEFNFKNKLSEVEENYKESIEKFFLKLYRSVDILSDDIPFEIDFFDTEVLTKALMPLYYNFISEIQKPVKQRNNNLINFFVDFSEGNIAAGEINDFLKNIFQFCVEEKKSFEDIGIDKNLVFSNGNVEAKLEITNLLINKYRDKKITIDELKSYLNIISKLPANINYNEKLYPLINEIKNASDTFDNIKEILTKLSTTETKEKTGNKWPNERILPNMYRKPEKQFFQKDLYNFNIQNLTLENIHNIPFYNLHNELFIPVPVKQGDSLFQSVHDCANNQAKPFSLPKFKNDSKIRSSSQSTGPKQQNQYENKPLTKLNQSKKKPLTMVNGRKLIISPDVKNKNVI